MIFVELLWSFFKIGMFTVGGGYAMLALIQQAIVEHGWLRLEEFIDIVAIAEMTPGPIAVNAATFVGFRSASIPGALVSTGAVVLPSLIGMLILSRFWSQYKDSPKVQAIFQAVRPAIAGLIISVAITLGAAVLSAGADGFNILGLVIAAGVFFAVYLKNVDPFKMIILCAILGLILFR